ncbi:hypothetical protein [Streptomyces albovinaceus]|uniref:hypothetical protein n=1 Tax=Streptomyces albovinaceus TaxID=66867 RepID=UPI000A36FA48|nr:hypothetical protein [Streptomyces albovinaceus]
MPFPDLRAHHRLTTELLAVANVVISLVVGLVATRAGLGTVITTERFGSLRLIVAFALFLLTAMIAERVLFLLLRPLHRPLEMARPASGAGTARALPSTTEAALTAVSEAAAKDAAFRAALDSCIIDDSKYLDTADRWRGYPAGDATLYLAPGTVLHCHRDGNSSFLSYTLHSSASSTPVAISNISAIWAHLSRQVENPAQGVDDVPADQPPSSEKAYPTSSDTVAF